MSLIPGWLPRRRDARGFPRADRNDSRVPRSFLVREGETMPAVGDVMVFGTTGPALQASHLPAPGAVLARFAAARVEGTMGRTVFYVPYPDDEVPLGADTWRMRRVRTGHNRYEEVAERRR